MRKTRGRDADFPSGISTFRFPPWLFVQPGRLFIFPSYPKHGNAPRSSDLVCHPDACTQGDPGEPSCPSPPFLVKAPPPPGSGVYSPLLCPEDCSGGGDVISCCSLSQRLSFVLLKRAKTHLMVFWSLFYSPSFICLCSSRHQSRLVPAVVFRR